MSPIKDPVSFLFIPASVPVSYNLGKYRHLTDRSLVKQDIREWIDLFLLLAIIYLRLLWASIGLDYSMPEGGGGTTRHLQCNAKTKKNNNLAKRMYECCWPQSVVPTKAGRVLLTGLFNYPRLHVGDPGTFPHYGHDREWKHHLMFKPSERQNSPKYFRNASKREYWQSISGLSTLSSGVPNTIFLVQFVQSLQCIWQGHTGSILTGQQISLSLKDLFSAQHFSYVKWVFSGSCMQTTFMHVIFLFSNISENMPTYSNSFEYP